MAFSWLKTLGVVFGCGACYQALGALWYGALFGARFLALAHPKKTKAQLQAMEKERTRGYVAAAAGAYSAMAALSCLVQLLPGPFVKHGLLLGALLCLFHAGLNAPHGFFEGRPFELYLLHLGYHVCGVLPAAVLMTLLLN